MMLKPLALILLLALPAQAQEVPATKEWVRQEIRATAIKEGVNPAFAQAVAEMESGRGLKCGQLNKTKKWAKSLHGPMGVRGCFLETGSPQEVIEKGVQALRGTETDAAKIKRLKRYNPLWWKDGYLGKVMARYRQLARQSSREGGR